ncbi:MAG TPA: alpha/beta hydrolase [Chloroflexi bacterium]|mgnify:CR=1 FL=1|nr:alpha/beta hydrolase [Chloroflexota bacterium]
MAFLSRNDLDIYYGVHGQGDPLLLIHGFGGTGHSDWKHQIPVFSKSFQVIAPDLRGHGRTDHPEAISGPEFFDEATEDMGHLLKTLDGGRAHVCGFSMGSSIAAWLCLLEPSLVRSLILVSGAARVNRKIAPGLFELWERMRDPDRIDHKWARTLSRLHGADKWRHLLRNYASAVIARIEADEEVAYSRGGEITCPTLIVQGSEDKLSPRLLSEELHASIPDSELVLLESEHWVPGLQPAAFNAVVLDFLRRRILSQVAI